MKWRPMILQFAGLAVRDFQSVEEALKAADTQIEANQAKYGWSFEDYPPTVNTQNPLFSEVFYLKNEGVIKEWTVSNKKTLVGDKPLSTQQSIQDEMKWDIVAGSNPLPVVKSEFPEMDKLKQQTEKLKSKTRYTLHTYIYTYIHMSIIYKFMCTCVFILMSASS